jgi:cbb3-type cytochrome oxidase maturation protein
MYYPFFLAYMITGLFIGGVVFYWAVKNGQFSDQQRARFLALEDAGNSRDASLPKTGLQIYFIFFLALGAIVASFALMGYALFLR